MDSPIIPNLAEFIPMLIAVALLVWVLGKFVWPSIMAALEAREEKIANSLKTAEDAKTAAEDILVQYKAKLEEGRKEAAAFVEEGKVAGAAAKAEILATAKVEADSLIERAQATADAKEKTAAADLSKQTANLAIAIASKIIGEKLGSDDKAKAEKLATGIGG